MRAADRCSATWARRSRPSAQRRLAALREQRMLLARPPDEVGLAIGRWWRPRTTGRVVALGRRARCTSTGAESSPGTSAPPPGQLEAAVDAVQRVHRRGSPADHRAGPGPPESQGRDCRDRGRQPAGHGRGTWAGRCRARPPAVRRRSARAVRRRNHDGRHRRAPRPGGTASGCSRPTRPAGGSGARASGRSRPSRRRCGRPTSRRPRGVLPPGRPSTRSRRTAAPSPTPSMRPPRRTGRPSEPSSCSPGCGVWARAHAGRLAPLLLLAAAPALTAGVVAWLLGELRGRTGAGAGGAQQPVDVGRWLEREPARV